LVRTLLREEYGRSTRPHLQESLDLSLLWQYGKSKAGRKVFEETMFAIYEMTPGPNGDEKRLICIRDSEDLAIPVWEVLYRTSIDWEVYVIDEVDRKGNFIRRVK